MSTNTIPKTLDPIISLGESAFAGAAAVGGAIDLKQNNAVALQATLRTVTGAPSPAPGQPPIPGTQTTYLMTINAVVTANADHRAALAAGRELSRESIDVLRHFLGRRWNSAWSAAGFTGGSLAVPNNPEARLFELRSYFGAHPEHTNGDLGITVAAIQQALDAIATSRQFAAAKLVERIAAKEARDNSVDELRMRLTGLRTELEQLIEPDDERWYQFGFVRPADGRMPATVNGLSVRAGLPGQAVISWDRSRLATSYRVSYRIDVPNAEPVLVGLFADRNGIVSGLPSGQRVVMASVTARNSTGETGPTETSIVVA